MWRIKNQPSNSTSCNDNALRRLVLVASRLYRGLQEASSFSIWDCTLKGYFERGIYFEGPNCVWRAWKTSILNTGPPRSPWKLWGTWKSVLWNWFGKWGAGGDQTGGQVELEWGGFGHQTLVKGRLANMGGHFLRGQKTSPPCLLLTKHGFLTNTQTSPDHHHHHQSSPCAWSGFGRPFILSTWKWI